MMMTLVLLIMIPIMINILIRIIILLLLIIVVVITIIIIIIIVMIIIIIIIMINTTNSIVILVTANGPCAARACVEAATHYVDVTGEIVWVPGECFISSALPVSVKKKTPPEEKTWGET